MNTPTAIPTIDLEIEPMYSKKVQMGLMVPKHEKDILMAHAINSNITLSHLVRWILTDYLDNNQFPPMMAEHNNKNMMKDQDGADSNWHQ